MIGCPRKAHFEVLISSIRNRLADLRANSLSFPGSLVLVKHVLGSLPLHIAMVLLLSKSVCYSIERLI